MIFINRTEIKERFLSNNIPYDDIDIEMIPLLDLLNFKFNIMTKFCCYGHARDFPAYIRFDESVLDENIHKIFKILYDAGCNGLTLKKEIQYYTGELTSHWTLEFPVFRMTKFETENVNFFNNQKVMQLDRIVSALDIYDEKSDKL